MSVEVQVQVTQSKGENFKTEWYSTNSLVYMCNCAFHKKNLIYVNFSQ